MYGRIPLFPPSCGASCMRMPLFEGCRPACVPPSCGEECQSVRIFNPACREEYVDVELCVEADGNLSVCVRRPPRPCAPPRRRCSCRNF